MIATSLLLLISLSLTPTLSTLGISYLQSDPTIPLAAQCLFRSGYEDATPILTSSPIQLNLPNLESLYKARNTFRNLSLIYQACPGRDAQEQVAQIYDKVPALLYDWIWVTGYNYQHEECKPRADKGESCAFMKRLVKAFEKFQLKFGIVAEQGQWTKVYGNTCDEFGEYPLYWNPYDWTPTFVNFKNFGRWQMSSCRYKAYAKQIKVCGVSVDLQCGPTS